MRGASMQRNAQLVLLCTTSLFGSSLNQCSRIKLPLQGSIAWPICRLKIRRSGLATNTNVPFQQYPQESSERTAGDDYMAEREGFEPSIELLTL